MGAMDFLRFEFRGRTAGRDKDEVEVTFVRRMEAHSLLALSG